MDDNDCNHNEPNKIADDSSIIVQVIITNTLLLGVDSVMVEASMSPIHRHQQNRIIMMMGDVQ